MNIYLNTRIVNQSDLSVLDSQESLHCFQTYLKGQTMIKQNHLPKYDAKFRQNMPKKKYVQPKSGQKGSPGEWHRAKLRFTFDKALIGKRMTTWQRATEENAANWFFSVGANAPQRRQRMIGPIGTITKCSTQQRRTQNCPIPFKCGTSKARVAPQFQADHIECSFLIKGVVGIKQRTITPSIEIWQGLRMNSPFPVMTFMQAVQDQAIIPTAATRVSKMFLLWTVRLSCSKPMRAVFHLMMMKMQRIEPKSAEAM